MVDPRTAGDAADRSAKPIIGVVGAGTMGAGIAQLALEAGHEVVLHDVDEAALERGRGRIRQGLERRAARLDLDPDSLDEWVEGRLAGLRDAASLDAMGAEAEAVIEAAVEDLELKRTIFRTLDAAAPPDVLLATNTSALSVTAIAAETREPGRILGLHFFNPAPVMKLVELVTTRFTLPAMADRAQRLVESWGRTTVRTADTPGFIVNRVNRPFTLEALAIVEAGGASIETIDRAIREAGFPMGPFELMDLVGIDVNLAAARGIFDAVAGAGDPLADRFRPSPIQERLVETGRLGRKSGEGFYVYRDGQPPVAAEGVGLPGTKIGADETPGDEIVERIRLAVAAEAYRALDAHVATAEDIDLALRLGAGHPVGPLEWAGTIGGREAVAALLAERSALGKRFAPPRAPD